MSTSSAAYDFELFEEKGTEILTPIPAKKGKTKKAPVKKQNKTVKKNNIVKMSSKQMEKNRRARINPFKVVVWAVSFCAVFGIVLSMVHSQVQLTELTNDVNAEFTALNEANSKSIYLNTKVRSNYDMAEVEKYVTESLGMTKMSEDQVSYVNLAQQDKGEVVLESKVSGVASLLYTIRAWFA